MDAFYSCSYIQSGLNFYPNNTIKMCCFSDDPSVDVCKTTDLAEDILRSIFRKKSEMLRDFKNGNVYESCQKCPNLVKASWGSDLQMIQRITLNHFMFCNLKCGHCGYLEGVENGLFSDTDHDRVLEIIQVLKLSGVTAADLTFDVGGGEPSVAKGLLRIVRYCLDNKHRIHINSNGAQYVPLFAEGINQGLLDLTLTPDAGSREVFRKIKGKDNFEHTWKNIEKYISNCQGNVHVKFILQQDNMDDIENMIEMSARVKARAVILSFDLRIPDHEKMSYAPYVHHFRRLAAEKSLTVHQGPLMPEMVWNASYESLPLPKKVFPIPVVEARSSCA